MPGYYFVLANVKCDRRIGTIWCKGIIQVAIGKKDWTECPSCLATGREGNKACNQCILGSGWLFLGGAELLSFCLN
jgi:hypothetical protein